MFIDVVNAGWMPNKSVGPGQSGRSRARTLDDQPGLIQHQISASSRVRPSAAASDLMSGDRARRHLQRPGDLLRRAPGVPQLTNTVKQLLCWRKACCAPNRPRAWLTRPGCVGSHGA
jgi:hypothetical protein